MIRRAWLPPLAWAAIILVLTSIPVPQSVVVPGGDKTAHVVMYGVLGYLSAGAALRSQPSWRTLLTVIVVIGIFAALDELHQQLIPGRFAERLDWFADVVGASLGSMLAVARLRARERTS